MEKGGTDLRTLGASLRERLPLLVLLFSALYMVALFNTKFFVGDEGVAALDAWRICAGQVPHRDFFEIVPPASFLPLALAFKLFGVSVLVERGLVLLLALALLLACDRLLRSFTEDWRARCLVAACLGPFGVSYWPLPSHHWMADLFQLLSLIALLAALRGGRPWPLGMAAGALGALACFSLQDQGAYFVAALALLFFPWIPERALRRTLSAAWVLGGALVAAAFALYLLPRAGLGALVDQWVRFPASRYGQITGNANSFFAGWSGVLDIWTTGLALRRPLYAVASFLSWSFVFGLPFLSLPLLVRAAWGRWRPFAEVGLLASAWVAFLSAALHRWSLTNLVWAAPAFLIPAAWGLSRAADSGPRWARAGARALLALATLGVVTYAAALLLDARGPRSFPVRGRAGTVRSLVPEESALLQQAVTAVEAHVPEGTPLFTTGFVPLVNFLTLTPPATRYDFFMYPTYHTEAQMEEVLRTLEERRVRFALLIRPLDPANRLHAYFLARFRPVWSNPVAVLVERAPEGAPGGEAGRGPAGGNQAGREPATAR